MSSKTPSRRTVWLFDLDNTLHNASASSFRLLDDSMNGFIERELGVDTDEANALRRYYWKRYGATLLGLIRHHGVRPAYFLGETHHLPQLESQLRSHPHDLSALRRLPGEKYILTNAPLAYTERVLKALGIAPCFDGIVSIERMRMFGHWRPKPDSRMFRALVARLRVAPGRCVLVEDTLAHQKSARKVGIRTVWMQRWMKNSWHGPEAGTFPFCRPSYVCARISSLQQLRKRVRHE